MRTFMPTEIPSPLAQLAGLAACCMALACSAASAPDSGNQNDFSNNNTIKGNTGGAGSINTGDPNVGGNTGDSLGAGGSATTPVTVSVPLVGDGGPQDAGRDSTCGSVEVDAHVDTIEQVVEIPGNVLFVFDQSSSMKEDWNGTPKWKAANDALVAGFESLQDKLSAGVILFPSVGTSGAVPEVCDWTTDSQGCLGVGTIPGNRRGGTQQTCEVAPITSAPQMAIQSGAAFLERWKAYWQGGDLVLRMGTPTEAALLRAEAALANPPKGNTVVVLLTDGQPNCGSNESAVAARLLDGKGIKTYVVGLPGAQDGVSVLDAIAKAGGTAPDGCASNCFLSPTNASDLQSALSNIASTTVTTTTVPAIQDCKFTLHPPEAADPADVHLIATDSVDGKQYEVPRTPGSGWTLSADNQTAVLEGALCEGAKTGKYEGFSFQYGCVSAPPLDVR